MLVNSLDMAQVLLALIILSAFLIVLFLGSVFLKLTTLQTLVRDNRETWIEQLRQNTEQLRQIRRAVQKSEGAPMLPLSPSLKKKWAMVGWARQVILLARRVRS